MISYGEGRDTPSFMALYAFFEANNPNDSITLQLSKGATKREVVLPLDYLLSLNTKDIQINMMETMGDDAAVLSMDKEIQLKQHAEEVIRSTQQVLDKSLFATARAVVNMASATGPSSLSICPINSPSKYNLSPHLLIHPINTPYQYIMSTHPINSPSQYTLSPHPSNTPYQHTLSTHPF